MPKGFTIVEILIALAVLAVIVGLTFPFYQNFKNNDALESVAWRVTSMTRQAQLRSISSEEDSSWGLAVSGSQATLFMGESYVSRDPSKDEIFNTDEDIVFSGDSEVVFSQVDGEPAPSVATIVITSGAGVINLNINEKGVVEY